MLKLLLGHAYPGIVDTDEDALIVRLGGNLDLARSPGILDGQNGVADDIEEKLVDVARQTNEAGQRQQVEPEIDASGQLRLHHADSFVQAVVDVGILFTGAVDVRKCL